MIENTWINVNGGNSSGKRRIAVFITARAAHSEEAYGHRKAKEQGAGDVG